MGEYMAGDKHYHIHSRTAQTTTTRTWRPRRIGMRPDMKAPRVGVQMGWV
jgi:hypothetical protein